MLQYSISQLSFFNFLIIKIYFVHNSTAVNTTTATATRQLLQHNLLTITRHSSSAASKAVLNLLLQILSGSCRDSLLYVATPCTWDTWPRLFLDHDGVGSIISSYARVC